MKKTIVLLVFAGMFAMQGCKQKSVVQMDGSDAGVANISKCDVRFNGVSVIVKTCSDYYTYMERFVRSFLMRRSIFFYFSWH